MPKFAQIKNKKLRKLVEDSKAILSLPKEERMQMVNLIAAMSKEGQKELIHLLKEEQQQNKKPKVDIHEADLALDAINKGFENQLREFKRENRKKKSEDSADKILESLN